jgi:hypothetical protein
MLIELKKLLSQELKYLFSKTTITVLLERTIPKAFDVSLLYFYCIKNILYRIVLILYRNVYVNFQEHNSRIKRDLPVVHIYLQAHGGQTYWIL